MKRFRKKKTPSEVSTEQPFFPKVQPKLRVGEPDDAFEKEADHNEGSSKQPDSPTGPPPQMASTQAYATRVTASLSQKMGA